MSRADADHSQETGQPVNRLDLRKPPTADRVLIEASAGTGKTYSIAKLVLHEILKGVAIESICVVTFTVAATAELRSRIRDEIQQALDHLSGRRPSEDSTLISICSGFEHAEAMRFCYRALVQFDQASIFTIHSFSQRLVKENAFESGAAFETELILDLNPILETIAKDFSRQHCYQGPHQHQWISCCPSLSELVELGKYALGKNNLNIYPKLSLSLEEAFDSMDELKKEAEKYLDALPSESHKLYEALYVNGEIKGRSGPKYVQKNWHKDLAEIESDLKNIENVKVGEKTKKGLDKFRMSSLALKDTANVDNPWLNTFDDMLTKLEINREAMEVGVKQKVLDYFKAAYQQEKQRLQQEGFDDFLLFSLESLKRSPDLLNRLRDQYSIAFLDEFQDTDHVQYQIFELIFGHGDDHRLIMIGDPKQAIYAFRGADIGTYLHAKKDAEVWTLASNFRSYPALVDEVNHLFLLRGTDSFAYDATPENPGITYHKVQGEADRGRLVLLDDAGQETEPTFKVQWASVEDGAKKLLNKEDSTQISLKLCAQEMSKWLTLSEEGQAYHKHNDDKKPLSPGDMAVLCFSHRELETMKTMLGNWGIPSVSVKSDSVFCAPEAQAMESFLRALINPSEAKLKRYLLETLCYLPHECDALDEASLMRCVERFMRYQQQWILRGPMTVFESITVDEKLKVRFLSQRGGERKLSNWFQLCELVTEAWMQKASLESLMVWFAAQKDLSQEHHEQRLETDAQAVKLVTIHGSKGLEYPMVFCPTLWSKSFQQDPKVVLQYHDDESDVGTTVMHLCKESDDYPEHQAKFVKEQLREQLRLIYVALTRPQFFCHIGGADVQGAESSTLQWLFSKSGKAGQRLGDARAFRDDVETWCKQRGHQFLCSREAMLPVTFKKWSASLEEPLAIKRSLKFKWERRSVSSFSALSRQHSGATLSTSTSAKPQERPEVGTIHDFPKGAHVGECLHEIFEELDFQAPEREERRIKSCLSKYGLDQSKTGEDLLDERYPIVEKLIHDTLNADCGGFRLKDIQRKDSKREMEFFLGVGTVDREVLGRNMVLHADKPVVKDYAEKLQQLSFDRFKGYITGFIDVCFLHEGKAYVLDWKSNFLGPNGEAYEQLDHVMFQHDYLLQYHLYVLAVHQHLQKKIPDYDYDEHFGGVIYPFLRGLKAGSSRGLYFDRPPKALICGLEKDMIETRETEGAFHG